MSKYAILSAAIAAWILCFWVAQEHVWDQNISLSDNQMSPQVLSYVDDRKWVVQKTMWDLAKLWIWAVLNDANAEVKIPNPEGRFKTAPWFHNVIDWVNGDWAIKFLSWTEYINDENLLRAIAKWEAEWKGNWWDIKRYYWYLKRLATRENTNWSWVDAIKKSAPNLWDDLYDNEYDFFWFLNNNIIKKDKKLARKEEELARKEEELEKEKSETAESIRIKCFITNL